MSQFEVEYSVPEPRYLTMRVEAKDLADAEDVITQQLKDDYGAPNRDFYIEQIKEVKVNG